MTRRLILMRHAKSGWDNPGLQDHERPLNGRGRASAVAMGNWVRQQGAEPDAVLSSSSQRTMETFEGLRFACPVDYRRDLYHASADTMLAVLREAQGACVLLLGHNPGISQFAEQIVAQEPEHERFWDYPTCATLIADFDVDDWRDVIWGSGVARAFAIPREVMAA